MKYINPNSNTGLVNLFADFILSKINQTHENDTTIKVTMFKPFFVVEGSTSSKEVLDLNEISNEFIKKYDYLIFEDNFKINIIDLIKYDCDVSNIDYFNIKFFNSENPLFNENVIKYCINNDFLYEYVDYSDSILIGVLDYNIPSFETQQFSCSVVNGCISSEFPYGFSLSKGRNMFYYLEHISNQVMSSSKSNNITLKYSKDLENPDFNLSVVTDGPYPDDKNKSIILDVFDFNMKKFTKNYLKDYDYSSDIINQLSKKPWLVKDKLHELYII